MLPVAATAYLTLKAGYHIEALAHAGRQTFAEFSSAMRADAAKAKINLSDADAHKLYKKATDDYLTKVRENLPETMRIEFDRMRNNLGDETLLSKLPKDSASAQKMFEGITANKAKQATKQFESEKRFETARQNLLNDDTFLTSPEVTKALLRPTSDEKANALRSVISVELTKLELTKQYPAAQGYRVISEVDLYQDTGFKTFKDWSAANGGKSPVGLEMENGRVWRKVTDLDVIVVKRSAEGKLQIIQLEQIKAGDNDVASKAKLQMQNSLQTLRGASNKDVMLSSGGDKKIFDNVDANSADRAKQVTRGLPGKTGFDESLPLNSSQMKKIAKEIESSRQKEVIK